MTQSASSLAAPSTPIDVRSPSGQTLRVLGPDEEAFYVGQARAYRKENSFTNPADLLDLDRLLFAELSAYRASRWLGEDCDYDGAPIDRAREQRTLRDVSDTISRIKTDLGLTKSARDKAQGESVGAYLTMLKARAREFGVHRETQLDKALTLMQQLFAIVGAFDRADAVERAKIGFESEAEILEWIRDTMRPEFEAVDRHFRSTSQKYWVATI